MTTRKRVKVGDVVVVVKTCYPGCPQCWRRLGWMGEVMSTTYVPRVRFSSGRRPKALPERTLHILGDVR